MNLFKIFAGDRVRVEMTPYDKTKGRIVFRMNNMKVQASVKPDVQKCSLSSAGGVFKK